MSEHDATENEAADRPHEDPSQKDPSQEDRPPAKRARSPRGGKRPAAKAPPRQRRSSRDRSSQDGSSEDGRDDDGPDTGGEDSGPLPAMRVAAQAMRQLQMLTGKPSEGITGMERNADGWTVLVEMLEMRRVPATTDVLATYEVDTDDSGELVGYRRRRRYVRGTPGDE